MNSPISIIVADDHPLYREGVVRTLEESADLRVVGVAGSSDEACALTDQWSPDVVLLDISMPGGGIDALRRLRADGFPGAIAMLTVSEDDDDVLQALKAGARGYILKGVGGMELVQTVRNLAKRQTYVSPELAAKLLTSMKEETKSANKKVMPDNDLTLREEEILLLVAKGLSNKEVARDLDLQEKTVKHYMTKIMQKLGLRNRVEAALYARDHLDID